MFIEQSPKKSPLSEICEEYITVKLAFFQLLMVI